MEFSELETLLIDGDGVLWRGVQPMPGLNHFFDVLSQRSIQWALLTNNNTRTVGDYVRRLQGFDLRADETRIFTSSTATADYLEKRYGEGTAVFVIGMRGVINTLEEAGFLVSHGEAPPSHDVVAVVAGMDRAISHEKIKVAMRLIHQGAEFIATNRDGSFPTPDGLTPGTGVIIAAIQAATEVEPTVIGKPQPAIYQSAMMHLNACPTTTAMIGDRLETDILGAQRLGLETIAVLTGVTTRHQIESGVIKPDHVYNDISGFADVLSGD